MSFEPLAWSDWGFATCRSSCEQIYLCFYVSHRQLPWRPFLSDDARRIDHMTICNGDERWKVIPVYPTRPVNKIPLGIRAINAISLSRIIYTGSMTSTLPILTRDNIAQFDRYFAKYLQNLFANKQHLRIRREEVDLRRLKLWLSQEREKRGWDSEDTSFDSE